MSYVFEERRDRFGFRAVPSCMYFYYIGAPRPGNNIGRARGDRNYPYIRHYYYAVADEAIEYEDLDELVRKLARNARKPEADQYPAPDGTDLSLIVWSRKSYIAFVLDDGTKFIEDNPIILDPHNTGKTNYSFFDGWCRSVDLSDPRNGSDPCSALCFMNHMKKNTRSDL